MDGAPHVEKVTEPGDIDLDRLRATRAPAQVLRVRAEDGLEGAGTRAPHRHDYHELFLVEAGSTSHRIDDEQLVAGAGEALLIGRGQVHVLEAAEGFAGVVVRFGEELLAGPATQSSPGWLLATCGNGVLAPPAPELAHAIALTGLLDDELRRPPDAGTDRLVAASLDALVAYVQRWQAARELGVAAASATDPDRVLLEQFGRLLEAEYQSHHDAGWYAQQQHVTANHLAAVLTRLTGRSTKRHITDRLMVECQRLLRYTELTVQQVAYRLGYDDPLYLSRAFKSQTGESPTAWRERHAGR